MNDKLIQRFIQEIGTLRVELLHRDVIIEQLREEIQQLQENQQQKETPQ